MLRLTRAGSAVSLYSFIHDRVDVQQGFGARLLRPRVKFARGLQAPPLTTNHQMVGGAFGYLLRFCLQRINPQARASAWVAERGADLIDFLQRAGKGRDMPTPSRHTRSLRAAAYVADAKRRCQAYTEDGQVTQELLEAAYRLAHLDLAIRAGVDRIDWRSINYLRSEDAADLKALLEIVDEGTFHAARACILDPRLPAAELVGGAYPDFILDHCVLDVNTSHEPRFDARDIYRLVGYYLLLGLGGISHENGKTEQCAVNSVGIYFARFGQLWKVPVKEILPTRSVPEMTRWFVESVCSSGRSRPGSPRAFEGPLAVYLSERDGGAVKEQER